MKKMLLSVVMMSGVVNGASKELVIANTYLTPGETTIYCGGDVQGVGRIECRRIGPRFYLGHKDKEQLSSSDAKKWYHAILPVASKLQQEQKQPSKQ